MAWDFSITGGHGTTIRQRLLKGITQDWPLSEEYRIDFLAHYHLHGLTAKLFEDLAYQLYVQQQLEWDALLHQLGFEEQYERRSKKANFALNQIFSHWHEQFYSVHHMPLEIHEASVFMNKETITELVDWITLCALLLNKEVIPTYYHNHRAYFIVEAERYTTEIANYEEMEAFVFDLPVYVHFQKEMKTCFFDLFYWCNAY